MLSGLSLHRPRALYGRSQQIVIIVVTSVRKCVAGVITSYSLYQNDVLVTQGLNLSHQLEGLQPYSLHVFRLQVCTSQGCGFSTEVSTTPASVSWRGHVFRLRVCTSQGCSFSTEVSAASTCLCQLEVSHLQVQVFISGLRLQH